MPWNRTYPQKWNKKTNQITNSFTSKYSAIKTDDGKLLTDKEQIRGLWKNYCKQLMKNTDQTADQRDITRQEVDRWNCRWNLVTLDDKGIDTIYKICQLIYEQDKSPDDWAKLIYVPSHIKRPKDICGNYRTIDLTSHASKVMLKILILERIKPYILQQPPPEQTYFVPGRDTREQMLNPNQIIEKAQCFDLFIYALYTTAKHSTSSGGKTYGKFETRWDTTPSNLANKGLIWT